jgi:ABC-type phosphate/phosphonate transport system substrate-binding protein
MAKSVPARLRRRFSDALLAMHRDAAGRSVLRLWGISHFARAEDFHYDAIRTMVREAQAVCW